MQTMNSHCLKWGIHFDLANKRDRVEELDKTMEDPGFWDDPEHSAKIVQETKKLKSVIERYESLESARDDILMLIEIAEEENDASVLEEVEDAVRGWFTGQRLGHDVLLAQLGSLIYGCDGVANYAILSPTTDVEVEQDVLPVLDTLTVEEMP